MIRRLLLRAVVVRAVGYAKYSYHVMLGIDGVLDAIRATASRLQPGKLTLQRVPDAVEALQKRTEHELDHGSCEPVQVAGSGSRFSCRSADAATRSSHVRHVVRQLPFCTFLDSSSMLLQGRRKLELWPARSQRATDHRAQSR